MTLEKIKKLLGLSEEQISEFLFPVLLVTAECFASLYAFDRISAYIFSVFFLVESVLLFRLFTRLHERKSGGLIYTLILTIVMTAAIMLAGLRVTTAGGRSALQWLYGQQDEVTTEPLLVAALVLGGAFFLISIVYYFSAVRYRTLGIMLCTMFPFFCFAMRSDDMPNILITVIMLLFLAVIIHNRRLNSFKKSGRPVKIQIDRAYIICIAVFTLLTGAITMAVDKPHHEAMFERNANFLTRMNFGVGGSADFESLGRQSSARNGRPDYDYNPLFYFETDSPNEIFFLRTKAFKDFNGDVWDDNGVYDWSAYSLQQPEYSTDDILADFSKLSGRDSNGLYRISSGRVSDESFTPWYLPAPLGVITDNMDSGNLRYLKLIRDTSVYRARAFYYARPLNDSFKFIDPQSGMYRFALDLNFSAEEYLEYLASFENSPEAKRLTDDYNRALAAYSDAFEVSDRLAALSKEIVADCHGDLEKAMKLENYFTENGFRYSLEYVPEDNSIDYFVFESKTGYCAGYATAMTLMARSVGLPARYVEGFAAFEKSPEGSYVIRDGYAHAFVEVYIPGAGWMTFDPTVADYRINPFAGANQGLSILGRILNTLNRISVIILIAVAVILYAFKEKIKEVALRLWLHTKPIKERIISLYGNLLRRAGHSVDKDFSSYTPDMLREEIGGRQAEVPERLIDLFEKTAFGGFECSKEEYLLAYKEYKRCLKKLK